MIHTMTFTHARAHTALSHTHAGTHTLLGPRDGGESQAQHCDQHKKQPIFLKTCHNYFFLL